MRGGEDASILSTGRFGIGLNEGALVIWLVAQESW